MAELIVAICTKGNLGTERGHAFVERSWPFHGRKASKTCAARTPMLRRIRNAVMASNMADLIYGAK
jgi:hypothetical protein